MENDYDRSEDDAWHDRIAAGRILSVLAAERLRAPRARTLWGTPAGARGSVSGCRVGREVGPKTRNQKLCLSKANTNPRISSEARGTKSYGARGASSAPRAPRARPREAVANRRTTSVAAVTCGVVTGRTARGAETGARGRNRHACSPDRASTPFGTLVALEHRGLSVELGGTFRLHISAGQLSPARRVATIFS
jgi:hypothetical protein